ncbi:polymerase delta-interacting protein 3 isoform X2 [Apus apus]|uniref:polymerase delta-interacting protein 3 isoform X2 n=1 Tax=Apus apus TaxID=8895 RepID=UPI0021F88382|nr:polymerase delta-interacting protein 3 isoform X2 [Apus apus]
MSGFRWLRRDGGPRGKMADLSLDELIRKRGVTVKGRLNTRPVFGGVRSRVGIQQNLLNRPSPAVSFQRTFDARQKIGLTDARHKLGVKDAREKLVQKDARFKIKGKVQDAREMLNSRKQQSVAAEKVTKVVDAREKISLKRSVPAAISPTMGTVNPAMKITKTIQKAPVPGHSHPSGMRINVVNNHTHKQGLYDTEDDDESVSPLTSKQMKITTTNSFLHNAARKGSFLLLLETGQHQSRNSLVMQNLNWQHVGESCCSGEDGNSTQAGLSGNKFSLSKTVPLTKVVQNDTYTAPPAPPSPMRTKALTNMSRTLVTKEEPPKEPAPVELAFSPLEGTKMTVNNLHPRVTEEDIVELFCVCGALKRARLVHPGVAEVVFVKKEDAITAYKKYNNRCLDGQPMKCNLHMNGNVITSDQPILLRLSDTPSVKKEGEPRRSSASASSNPPAEVDPDTILKALFKSSGVSSSVQPTEFKIKL